MLTSDGAAVKLKKWWYYHSSLLVCLITLWEGLVINDEWKEVSLMKELEPLIWAIYIIFSRSYECHKNGRSHITVCFG